MTRITRTSSMSLLDSSGSSLIFENLPALISLEEAAVLLNREITTFYDWRYRGQTRKRHKIPPELFVELNGHLFINKAELERWLASQNSRRRRETRSSTNVHTKNSTLR